MICFNLMYNHMIFGVLSLNCLLSISMVSIGSILIRYSSYGLIRICYLNIRNMPIIYDFVSICLEHIDDSFDIKNARSQIDTRMMFKILTVLEARSPGMILCYATSEGRGGKLIICLPNLKYIPNSNIYLYMILSNFTPFN